MGEVIDITENDFKCTGGELPHGVDDVWALPFFGSQKAHFFKRTFFGYQSICGRVEMPAFLKNGQNPLFDPGTYPKCKVCMNKLRKSASEKQK
jgi:hypothetical protein